MATRVDRQEDLCEDQVIEALTKSCTLITFDERGQDALRRYKAVFGYVASVFSWE